MDRKSDDQKKLKTSNDENKQNKINGHSENRKLQAKTTAQDVSSNP